MSEYIYTSRGTPLQDISGEICLPRERIVRCGDCEHYYETKEYHPQGNYDRRCCKYFDTFDDEVEPDGYCKWAKRKEQSR